MSQSTYEAVTFRIIEALQQGVVPWRKPWHESNAQPCNGLSMRPYHGINLFLLSIAPYRDHRWLTFSQARQLGGYVKPGETSSLAVFWKRWEPTSEGEEEGQRRSIPLLKHYHLFNVEQCADLSLSLAPELRPLTEHERIERAELLIRCMPDPPRITEGQRGAWYRPTDDLVGMPPLGAFKSADDFYGTLFHELGHATGHEKRLNRPDIMGTIEFGSLSYGREELVAELTSAFCAATVGLDNRLVEGAASYIGGWLKLIKANPKAVVIAASQAKRAADHIQGVTKASWQE